MSFADSAKKQAESAKITLRPMGLFFRQGQSLGTNLGF